MTPLKPIENLFAVEVPGDALPGEWKIFEVDGENYLNGMTADGEMYAGLEPLPPGSYEILFTTSEVTEEKLEQAGIATKWLFLDILSSNNLDPNKNYLLIKKTT